MHAASLTCCLLLSAWMLSCDGLPIETKKHFIILKDVAASHSEETREKYSGCEYLDLKDVKFLENGNMLILSYNITMTPTRTYIIVDNVRICFNRSEELKREILQTCEMWLYEKDEFKILENGSVVLLSTIPLILESGTYEIEENGLHTCVSDDVSDENSTFNDDDSMTYRSASAILGRVGSSISVVAITVHLIIFCSVPPLRNLPGYNLASLSIAFLIAYSSVIIGQIPSVLGLACIISGVLQLNCFLVAFFCMNVMAFDVWRTLRLATSKLAVTSENKKKIQFIIYTCYSWGVPFIITVIVVILDNLGGIPSWIKPRIGDKMICWITNNKVKIIFFSVPAFILFMANGVFFVLSATIIKNNTMQNVNDQHNQTVRLNFVLYVRLGLMMGVTWLFSVLATLTNSSILWLISDFLNPLQGLFIFILFTCSPKVLKYVKQRVRAKRTPKTSTTEKKSCSSSDKNTTNSSTATTQETTFSFPGHQVMTPKNECGI
ncbi:G-protein coupled receptor Mth2-like [Argiope bruennichi]|uniref:G-protein coupled receptor Mth2 like protein n=1 Tax=Argiope bruennichi TaxID=94029 RepID=A0A8T0EMD4_ARGBR|nr:G-protein coupled receptor Mth2-like [Argiope bruennichi]XP_055946317.1 G-protein coupled receptor Mth2-like [Argiope bruennichi]XP_055946318.1 G-protein coupled receptor Mth2-like [Argiope bruennichi]KAF8777012.1 G-protein coupled receptor Mth2 like protein [Argiope bruennichi]